MRKRIGLGLTMAVLLAGGCGGDKEAAKPAGKPKAPAVEKAKPARSTLVLKVAEASRLAEIPGEPLSKALPGTEYLCVRYVVKASQKTTIDPATVILANGKTGLYKQHAAKKYGDETWPTQGAITEVEAGSSNFSLCFELNPNELVGELTLQITESGKQPVSAKFAAPPAGDVAADGDQPASDDQ